MTFDEILGQAIEMLQRRGRVSYGALKRQFELDEEFLADLKSELIEVLEVAADQDGKMLVWKGTAAGQETEQGRNGEAELGQRASPADSQPVRRTDSRRAEAERRHLTVMFCDLVGSTTLSEYLDPEDLRELVQAYYETCAGAITRYAGYTAQHLGDGLLVYFGYPAAHEDEAARAVRTALEILAGLQLLNAGLRPALRAHLPHPLQVRIGIHTGLVVIGEIGSGEKREILAMGETPNIGARLQGLAEPDTVVISRATQRLVQGLFECHDRGLQEVKGLSTPLSVYQVMYESAVQSRFEAAVSKGLTPLVGRELEVGLLHERWTQAQAGAGQVVLLSGEPGIGKSRLVQELKEQLAHEEVTRIEFRCSPYHQNSALYPIIDHLQRLLQFAREDAPIVKLEKLQHTLSHYHFPQADTVPLLAALLSLPHPEGYPPITVSPQKQKEKTQTALVAWLVEETEKAAVLCAWEDVHWADPSTLEVLTLLLDQVPATRLLALLTFRSEFTSSWGNRSHLSQLTLSRLGHRQVEAMVERVTDGRALPSEVVQQIVAKTDGVPLFVEELTKTVLESGLLREEEGRYVVAHGGAPIPPLAIPATLQDSLMARLDRLSTVREIAQLAATIGREFSYELLQAVSQLDEERLQQGLKQLVEAELVYQRGLVPQATYLFKHALIQDVAYQSLLKSTRQQYHRQIAQVLVERFPETVATQPELLAHHYTEAGLSAQAIPYWQQAGQRAIARSANVEAISHLTKGLEVLNALPDTPERTQQELTLQIVLGVAQTATKGYAASEVARSHARARELCQHLGETPQLFPVLWGLWAFYHVRREYKTERELAEQLLSLAQRLRDPGRLLEAHQALAETLSYLGELAAARAHGEQGTAHYAPHQPLVSWMRVDSWVNYSSHSANVLWLLGYPDQARKRSHEALTRARELAHPFTLAYALLWAGLIQQVCREEQAVQREAEALTSLASEQGFPEWLAWGTSMRGWALAVQGQGEEGIMQLRQGLAAVRVIGAEIGRPYFLALLAEAHGKEGQTREGLSVLAEALAMVDKNEERLHEPELYRLKGELTLKQSGVRGAESELQKEAEGCFHKAIEIARKQQAKSPELRAVMSLARLWQQQGKRPEAHQLLSEIYNWFTEGFETKDLQEAKALLEKLS